MCARILGGLALTLTFLAGCAERAAEESPSGSPLPPVMNGTPQVSASDSPPPADGPQPTPASWTVGIVDVAHQVTGAALLTDVRTASNEGFDRVVLEFEGEELPSYHIEYVDRPVRQCGSGDPVQVAGDGWLLIRIQPANAHDEQGNPTVSERSRQLGLPVMRQLTLICDFEAQVEWIVGVASPNPYRVMELAEPARLVVDVRH